MVTELEDRQGTNKTIIDTKALIKCITDRKDITAEGCKNSRKEGIKEGLIWMTNPNRANGVATRHEIKHLQEAANLSKESAIEITRMAEETLLKEYAKELVAKAEAIADVKKKELHKKQIKQKAN